MIYTNNLDDIIIQHFRKLYFQYIEDGIQETSIIGFTNNLIINFK